MAKQQVHHLISNPEASGQYDFILIGIICQRKDYLLCFELNRKLEINLVKCEDHELLLNSRKTPSAFAKFRYNSPQGDDFVLLSNKGTRGTLLKEQPQLDYLLLITENQPHDSFTTVVKTLKDIPIILGAFPLNPLELPSREYLIME